MRSLFWFCAALVVVGGVISTIIWRQLYSERQLAALLRTQVSEAATLDHVVVPTALPDPPTTANEPGVPEPNKSEITPAKRPTVAEAYAAQAADAEAARLRRTEQQRDLWKDPGYRNARLAQFRSSILRTNLGLADELGLAPGEADALFDLLAEYELNMNANMATIAAASGDSLVRQEISNKLQEISRQRDAAISAQLGSVKYAQWQQYGQNGPARSQADFMRSALAQANQALNPEQLKALTAVLVNDFRRQREERSALTRNVISQDAVARAQVENELQLRSAYNQRVLAAVAPVLSAEQLAIVSAQMEHQDAMSRALMRARDLEVAAQAQGEQ